CFKRKNREIIQYLNGKTQLSDARVTNIGKAKLQRLLKKSDGFKHLVIPTKRAKSFKNVEEYVGKHESIVMKPLGGEQGKGVYILKKKMDGNYLLGYQKEEKTLYHQDLKEFFKTNLENKRYILQKYINSRSLQGDPFDCRVHMEKNGKGEWQLAKSYIRIGVGQKVVSNINQGGGIGDVKPFLEANYGD